MFSKRLAGMVPEARKYVAASVALQWVALAANIALMLLMGAFVQSLVEGGDVAASRANLVMAAAAAIVVRVCCLTLSQRMGQAAAAAAEAHRAQARIRQARAPRSVVLRARVHERGPCR